MLTQEEKIKNLIRQAYCAGSLYEIWTINNPKVLDNLNPFEKVEFMEKDLQKFILDKTQYIEEILKI